MNIRQRVIKTNLVTVIMLSCVICPQLPLQANDHLTLVWGDEFDYTGLPDTNKWDYDVGGHGWGNSELQYYTENRSENARVVNGVLIIEAHQESFQGRNYTSARVISKNKGDWKYGRFEIRAKLPKGRGTWPAIWMLPTDWVYGGWPSSGEIDIMEHVGYDMNRVHGTIHTSDFNHTKGTQIGTSVLATNVDTEFHDYALEWREDRIDIFLDGEPYFSVSDNGTGFAAWPFDQRFHLLLNIAVGGAWGGVQGIDDSIFSQRMEIDYVRVYAFDGLENTPAIAIPGKVEAEAFTNQFGIQLEQTSDTGGGSNAGYLTHGDWADYALSVQVPGRYVFNLRYASPSGTTAVDLAIDVGPEMSSGLLPATGGWQAWQTHKVLEANLAAGEVNLKLTIDSPVAEDLNYNWIEVTLLEASVLADPFSDPDEDGIINIFEYAYVLNNLEKDSLEALPFVRTVEKVSGQYLQITYRQRTGGTGITGVDYRAAGMTYRVEVSGTLQKDSWESGTSLFRSVSTPIDNGDGSETVTVEFVFPLGSSKRFIRLKLFTEE